MPLSRQDRARALEHQIGVLIAQRNQAQGKEKAEIATRISALRQQLGALR